jgi:hypothetical protein
MAKSDYISQNDDAFAAQILAFKNAIAAYAVLLGLTPAQVAAQAADADYFSYVLACRDIIRNANGQWSNWKSLLRTGGDLPPSGAPVDPVLPAAPLPIPAPGIEVRFRALVKQIKGSPAYNESIGAALGIEGSEQTAPDLTTVQPDIDATVSGAQVNISWGWQGLSAFLDMIELVVDRSDTKGEVFLANDTTPNYTDTTPFPATPTKWTYRAIYRVGDSRVGQWSKPVSVTVGG